MSYNSNWIHGEKVKMSNITNVTLACDDDRQTGANKASHITFKDATKKLL